MIACSGSFELAGVQTEVKRSPPICRPGSLFLIAICRPWKQEKHHYQLDADLFKRQNDVGKTSEGKDGEVGDQPGLGTRRSSLYGHTYRTPGRGTHHTGCHRMCSFCRSCTPENGVVKRFARAGFAFQFLPTAHQPLWSSHWSDFFKNARRVRYVQEENLGPFLVFDSFLFRRCRLSFV